MTAEKPIDPLLMTEEEFTNQDEVSFKLFEEGDVTLRTDLNDKEVTLSNAIFVENELLKNSPLKFDLYGSFLNHFKRHKVSRNRLSRMEFVDINRKDRFEQNLTKFANLKNLVEPRT